MLALGKADDSNTGRDGFKGHDCAADKCLATELDQSLVRTQPRAESARKYERFELRRLSRVTTPSAI